MAEVDELNEQADRYAAALMAECRPAGYEQTQAVIARAYAEGRLLGYQECARLVGAPVTTATEEPTP